MTIKSFHHAGLLSALLFVFTAGQLRAELPPESQEAIKKGILAAKQQDYLLAVRYFQDARKIAPDAPEIFFNLGLAESKIPSRELRAIAWFGAYLAATTNTPNAAAVKDQIDALEVKSQSNLSHLIQTALKTADLIQDAFIQASAFESIAKSQVKANDIAGAKNTFASAEKAADSLLNEYPQGTFQTTRQMEKNNIELSKGDAVASLAKAGDLEDAQKVADSICNGPISKGTADTAIEEAQKKAASKIAVEPTVSIITVSNWLVRLDDSSEDWDHPCALSTDPFLDLGSYLTAQHSDDPKNLFNALEHTIEKIVIAQNTIDRMLKQQAKQQTKS